MVWVTVYLIEQRDHFVPSLDAMLVKNLVVHISRLLLFTPQYADLSQLETWRPVHQKRLSAFCFRQCVFPKCIQFLKQLYLLEQDRLLKDDNNLQTRT